MSNQHKITVTALGPDSGELLTAGALEAMRSAKMLVLRTERHGVAQLLREQGMEYKTLDALYECSEDFDDLLRRAVRTLLRAAETYGSICYAVSEPHSDATVRALAKALPQNVTMQVIGGVALADCAACAVLPYGVDTENLRTITALSVDALRPQADTPQVITEIDRVYMASDVKLWLEDLFDETMTVYFFENAAEAGCRVKPIPLSELDRQPHYDHRTAVLIPAVSVYERSRATYEDLREVIGRLRAPGGCPWDRAQTHRTLRQYMIEEACEAADAMNEDDPMKTADELGDVLLQVVLNSCIGAEQGDFTDRDVTSMVTHKMISRHEHVFGSARAESASDVGAVWEKAKQKERGQQTAAERMREVAQALPALMRAQKVQKRMGDVRTMQTGEEQVRTALDRLCGCPNEETAGELLYACAALCKAAGVDAETALRARIETQIREAERREECEKHTGKDGNGER